MWGLRRPGPSDRDSSHTHVGHELIAAGMLIMAGGGGVDAPGGSSLEAREPEDGHERVDREAPRQEEQDKPHPAGPEAR